MNQNAPGAGEALPAGGTVGGSVSGNNGAGEALPAGGVVGGTPSQTEDVQNNPYPSTFGGVGEEEFVNPFKKLGDEHGITQDIRAGAEHLSNMGTNFVKGGEGTVAGVAKMLGAGDNDVVKGLDEESSNLAGDGSDKAVGYGGETLMEFLLGDEALKSLSVADKLLKSGQVARILQNSPRLMKALQAGANLEKAKGLLSPTIVKAIEESPVLGRLVSAGMEAVRAGVVQGTQTTVKTGGDIGEGIKQGLEMATGAGAVGLPLGAAGGVLAKMGKAGKVIEAGAGKATAAETERLAGADAVQQSTNAAQSGPTEQQIAQQASDMLNQAHDMMGARYRNGVDSRVIKPLQGIEVPLEGSDYQAAAKQIMGLADNDDAALKALGETTPASADAKSFIKQLGNAFKKEEKGAAPKADDLSGQPFELDQYLNPGNTGGEPQQDYMLDINKLEHQRRILMEGARDARSSQQWTDAKAYSHLIDGIDGTIDQIAQQSGNPQVISDYRDIRTQYRDMKELFEDKDSRSTVNSLMRGGITDTLKESLLNGPQAPVRVNTLRQIAAKSGQDFQVIGDALTQDIVRDGGEKLVSASPERINRIADVVGPKNMESLRDLAQKHITSQGAGDIFKSTPTKIGNLKTLLGDKRMDQLTMDGFRDMFSKARNQNGHFDVETLVDNWAKMMRENPEGIRALATPGGAMEKRFTDVMKEMGSAASAQRLIRVGLLPAAGITLGSAAGHVIGPVGYLLSATAGISGFKSVRELLDQLSAKPKLWSTLVRAAKVAEKFPAKTQIKQAAKYAAGRNTISLFSNAKSSLSGQ